MSAASEMTMIPTTMVVVSEVVGGVGGPRETGPEMMVVCGDDRGRSGAGGPNDVGGPCPRSRIQLWHQPLSFLFSVSP